jgi:hypothetical protein
MKQAATRFVELAMKHLGLLKERVEVEGKMTLKQLIIGSNEQPGIDG